MKNSNILLLAISVLPKNVSESTYITAFDDFTCKGQSQLEPVAQYMIEKLGHIDEIIMMCTDKALEVRKIEPKYSAAQYFEQRMNLYTCDYPTKYTVIQIQENSPEAGIAETVEKIRKLIKENGYGNFWVDTHGGLREIAMINAAIVSLLKVDHIVPDQIYGMEYVGAQGKIVNQKQSFKVFDFVSGMNDFINYGNASMLQEYYKNEDAKEIKDVLKAMNIVAEGTQVCDTKKYLQGLDELGVSIQKIKKTESLFSIFIEYIKADYGDLLYAEKRTVIGMIQHCIEKQLYQQALTLIESHMPKEYVDKGFLYYEDSEQNRKILSKAKAAQNKMWQDDKHFLFDTYVTRQFYFFKFREKEIELRDAVECFSTRKMKQINSSFIEQRDMLEFRRGKMGEVFGKISVFSDIQPGNYKKAGQLMRMHKALKACRNALNHGNPNRPEMKKIIEMMKFYCEVAQEMLESLKEGK